MLHVEEKQPQNEASGLAIEVMLPTSFDSAITFPRAEPPSCRGPSNGSNPLGPGNLDACSGFKFDQLSSSSRPISLIPASPKHRPALKSPRSSCLPSLDIPR